MRNETLKNLLLTASLISASALLTACGDKADPAKPSEQKLAAAEAARIAAMEQVAELKAQMNGLEEKQRAAAEQALAARRAEDKERANAEREIITKKFNSLRDAYELQLKAVSDDKFKQGQKLGRDELTKNLFLGVDSFLKDMSDQRLDLDIFLDAQTRAHDELTSLKDYALPAVKSVAEFQGQLAERLNKRKAVADKVAELRDAAATKRNAVNQASERRLSEFGNFINQQEAAFGDAAKYVMPQIGQILEGQQASAREMLGIFDLNMGIRNRYTEDVVARLAPELDERTRQSKLYTEELQDVSRWPSYLQLGLSNSAYTMGTLSTFNAAFKTFFNSHSEALINGAISSDAFVEDFLTSEVSKHYTIGVRLDGNSRLSQAQLASPKVIPVIDTGTGRQVGYYVSTMTLSELAGFFNSAADLDILKSNIKQLMIQSLTAHAAAFFSDTAPAMFKDLADRLKRDLPLPVVVEGGAAQLAAALSAGLSETTVRDISKNVSLRTARTAATGSVDASTFNMNGVSGQSIELGMPLFVQLKGDVSSAKSTDAATGSVAYRLGNTVIGAIQGYANSGAGFGIDSRQLETSVVASHSFGSFFVEGQIGSVSATDVHNSDWSGVRSQLTLGLDTAFVSPFVQVSHRQLDRSGLDLSETTGYVGLDAEVAKLAADTYSIDTRLLAKAGYGSKAWSLGSKDLGSTTGFSGSVEWSASLNLNSGVSFSSNLGLDTVAGSSAAVNVSLDR